MCVKSTFSLLGFIYFYLTQSNCEPVPHQNKQGTLMLQLLLVSQALLQCMV